MTTNGIDRNRAAGIFLSMLITIAHDEVVEDMKRELSEGPPGRGLQKGEMARHRWFQSLSDEDREHVLSVARDAVDAALFECLVLLDGMTGGFPIPEQPSDFGLYLQVYEGEDAHAVGSPCLSVRINPVFTTEAHLHDRYRAILEERARMFSSPSAL